MARHQLEVNSTAAERDRLVGIFLDPSLYLAQGHVKLVTDKNLVGQCQA